MREVLHEDFSGFYVLDSKSFCNFLEEREIMITERDLETFEREGVLLLSSASVDVEVKAGVSKDSPHFQDP